MAGGIDASSGACGDSIAGVLAAVPGLQDRCDLRQPRHEDRTTGIEDNDRSGIDRRDCSDERVLTTRERQARAIDSLGREIVGEDERVSPQTTSPWPLAP